MRLSNARKIWLTLLSLVALVVSTFVSGMPAMSMMGEAHMMPQTTPCQIIQVSEAHHPHHASPSKNTNSVVSSSHISHSDASNGYSSSANAGCPHAIDDHRSSVQSVDCSSSDMVHTCCTSACGNTLGLSPITLNTNGHSSCFSKRSSEHSLSVVTRIEPLERPPTI
ncbi:hypothetical protein [Vibrio methylphosphonaticus]|uniref:hypothetical protein n=1 Tax=Vibrio methylphosphonaticus TaxID=2946866 RepID=UPI00202A689B|nr:hypothetical protein [Vibrio methylphosphonaticus]MCL9776826.1 hypothetical protein [Vibrio methylphosphonaticus]